MKPDTEKVTDSLQWWIQDLPDGWGGTNPKGVGANILFWPIFPQKLHENKKYGRGGGARPCSP